VLRCCSAAWIGPVTITTSASSTQTGRVRWRRRIAHDPTGIAELRAAITTQEPDPANVCVAVEINHRLIVGALVEAGYVVDPINPKAAERFRDRPPAGGKNDRLDAEVLAQAVRTDRASLRAAAGLRPSQRDRRAGARPARAGARAHPTRQPAAIGAGRVFPAALVAFDLDAGSAISRPRPPQPSSPSARPEIARAQARLVRVAWEQLRVRRHRPDAAAERQARGGEGTGCLSEAVPRRGPAVGRPVASLLTLGCGLLSPAPRPGPRPRRVAEHARKPSARASSISGAADSYAASQFTL